MIHRKRTKDYSFRVRIIRSPQDALDIDSNRLDLSFEGSEFPIYLCSMSAAVSIKKSDKWIFESSGWTSEKDAQEAAEKYTDALVFSLARLRIGVDFGFKRLKSVITKEGLKMLEQQIGRRVLAEIHGIQIYETNPQPRFAAAEASAVRYLPKEKMERIFLYAVKNPRVISQRERLALELFNESFFQKTGDTRFLLLIMAVESLLEPSQRSSGAIQHVEKLIALTKGSSILVDEEKDSMLGSLKWLKQESINQTGRKLASTHLDNRRYMAMIPEEFFSYCYRIRSKMVHGDSPFPTLEEINSISGTLEVFVSDLLSGPLLAVDL